MPRQALGRGAAHTSIVRGARGCHVERGRRRSRNISRVPPRRRGPRAPVVPGGTFRDIWGHSTPATPAPVRGRPPTALPPSPTSVRAPAATAKGPRVTGFGGAGPASLQAVLTRWRRVRTATRNRFESREKPILVQECESIGGHELPHKWAGLMPLELLALPPDSTEWAEQSRRHQIDS